MDHYNSSLAANPVSPLNSSLFFPQCIASGRKNPATPHLSHSVVKLIEIAYFSRNVEEYYVFFEKNVLSVLRF